MKPGPHFALRVVLLVGIPWLLSTALLVSPFPRLTRYLADPAGTRITDAAGAFLGVMPGEDDAFQLQEAPSAIPPACGEIFVRLEDARFRLHPGIDARAIVRAAVAMITGRGARSGASTITMQLARLVTPHARSPGGKLVEAANALRIEARLTKDRILAAYLNSVPFGRNTRGVGAAAWTYFDTDLGHLSRAQLLALGVIPRNPTLYDPLTNPDRLIVAARDIAARYRLGVDPADIEAAVRGAHPGRPEGDAPHFTRYIAGLVQAGKVRPIDGQLATTLDLSVNHYIEARTRYVLARYESARVTNASVVVIDNRTGAVVGWVGSRDFFDAAHSGQIDGALIRRQSASTLKPFLYARAIEKGWTAATLLPDVSLAFGAADEEAYSPENFDKRSHGVVRVRTALASSLNVPAVYTLSHVGLADFLSTLRSLGFALPPDAASRYGMGAAIGNAEVSLAELVHAFSVFPRQGMFSDLMVARGQEAKSRRIFDPFAAWIVANILSDPSARATGFGTRTYFRTPVPAMFKTGTSSEFTNLWCIGATTRYTVGAWAGNFDGRAVINKTGSIVPTQIVSDVLTWLETRAGIAGSPRAFAQPPGTVAARICTVSGGQATPGCPSTRTEYFRSLAEVPPDCLYHPRHESDQALLEDAFLEKGQALRILFPVPGQSFYFDETLRAGVQSIPVAFAERRGEEATVSFDGRKVTPGASGVIAVPLERGTHSIVLSSPAGSDRVSFTVR